MKKTFMMCLVALGALFISAAPASACPKGGDHPHPFMVLEHAKELGLSKKQKSQIKKIEENLKNEMHGIWKKYGEETNAVLTDQQKKKVEELKSSHGWPHHKKGKYKGYKKGKGSCE